jgi:gliding-associated putative ABC transporter substrate-binding component GldG
MITDQKRKRTYASNALLYALFVVGTIVVVNLLGTRVFGRIDLTENDIYTLSQPSKDLVKKLPDYMTVKAFISNDLPPELTTVSRYVRDLVDEYKTSSNGKFKWESIDPGIDKKLEDEATRCKVQKLQVQVLRNQKFELGAYYLGLCLQYGNEIESIPQVVRAEGLEYQMSSLIKKLTSKKKKVAFTTGHGESETNQGFQSLKGALEQEFELTTVNPAQAEIGKDVDALVVGGPKQAFDEKGQREIDKFLMEGKGVIFLVDGIVLQAPGGMGGQQGAGGLKMGQPNDSGLGKILEAYGFKVNQDFVFDNQNAPGPIDINGRPMLANLPFFVAAEMASEKELTVLDGVRGAVFPFASSVDLVGPLRGGKPASGKLWSLARSSKESWKHTGFFVLGPGTKIDEPKERASFNLAYAYQGPLRSAFAPANPPAVSDPSAPAIDSKRPVRLVVVGDSDFANDEYVQLSRFLSFYGAGAQLMVNAIAWTVEDEALTPLRSKNVIPRPIKVSSEAAAAAIQWGNVLGVPLAFCLFGLVRWRLRRANRLGQKL